MAMGNMLHWNEVVLRGRTTSTDGVVHDEEGLVASWFPRTCREFDIQIVFWLPDRD